MTDTNDRSRIDASPWHGRGTSRTAPTPGTKGLLAHWSLMSVANDSAPTVICHSLSSGIVLDVSCAGRGLAVPTSISARTPSLVALAHDRFVMPLRATRPCPTYRAK